jgi:hypothetical protein
MLLDLAKVKDHDNSSPLYGLPQDVIDALRDLGVDLAGNEDLEPFYENEPVQEIGYAFENTVGPTCPGRQSNVHGYTDGDHSSLAAL